MLFRSEKRFLCKSAWLTTALFSVFISSEICTVKTLKYVPFFVKKTQSAPIGTIHHGNVEKVMGRYRGGNGKGTSL